MAGPKYPQVVGYDLVQQIGDGGFSRVFRAVNLRDHPVAACKVITITEATSEWDSPDVGVGDDVAHFYFNQLVAGMTYTHSEGACHRDLKPENLLLDITRKLKISDFGLSSVFELKEMERTRTQTKRCGSLPYVTPKRLDTETPYQAELVDVWGVGVILFTLLAGNTPWDQPTEYSSEFSRHTTGEIFSEAPWDRFGSEALDLIRGLLTIDPQERLTFSDALQHPWCIRPSQLAKRGPASLAEDLAAPLPNNGDLELGALPDFHEQFVPQTQTGKRSPHLTRFYASLIREQLTPLIHESLQLLGVTCRLAPSNTGAPLRLRIGGFTIMPKDKGNPISWRQLWRALIVSLGFPSRPG
ncbi:kinase-like domain-containing protein [Mycena sp. CBHHK59/15]|nr:kinase-like domain-containing protein [Mycena sp. CBHHK59/15]